MTARCVGRQVCRQTRRRVLTFLQLGDTTAHLESVARTRTVVQTNQVQLPVCCDVYTTLSTRGEVRQRSMSHAPDTDTQSIAMPREDRLARARAPLYGLLPLFPWRAAVPW